MQVTITPNTYDILWKIARLTKISDNQYNLNHYTLTEYPFSTEEYLSLDINVYSLIG